MDTYQQGHENCFGECSRSYNYNNCVVTTHDSEENVSFDYTGYPENQSNQTDYDDIDSDYKNVLLDIKDSFILMVGLLNRLEKYFEGNVQLDKEHFLDDVVLIKNVLLYNRRSFGHADLQNINGTLYINDESPEQKETVIESTYQLPQDVEFSEDQVNNPNDEKQKMNKQKKINKSRPFVKSKVGPKVSSVSKKRISKKETDKLVTSTPNVQKNIPRQMLKRKYSSEPKSQIDSKRRVLTFKSMDTFRREAMDRSALTGEHYKIALYNLQKEAGLNPILPKIRGTPEYSGILSERGNQIITESNKVSVNKRLAKSCPKPKRNNSFQVLSKKSMTNSDLKLRSSGSLFAKRKLYSPEEWLGNLSKTYQ